MKDGGYSIEAAVAASQYIKERKYWLNKLSGAADLEKSTFPYDTQRPPAAPGEKVVDTLMFTITGDVFSKLMKLTNGSDPRLHIALAAAVMVLRYKYTGSSEIITGTPTYHQSIKGELINTVLALRNHVNAAVSFKEFLLQVARCVFEANENQNCPLELLLSDLQLSFDHQVDEFLLFEVAVLLANIQSKDYIKHLKLNMIFSFFRKEEKIEGMVEYNASLYKKTTIQKIIGHFSNLMTGVVFDPGLRISDIELLTGKEKKQLLNIIPLMWDFL